MFLCGARLRLVQLMQNLIGNAVKFMGDQPDPRVTITVRPNADETVFVVADNGIGIDQRFQEKIFGLFEQLDPNHDGTGIGLALVARIVEMHGGRIWAESAGDGTGSAFCFTLPGSPQNGESPDDSK